ncbi:MAG TPA: hypothetical protein PKE66_14330, partial [Pyrinomonadaceae bacterium]|nr:hypothetical protein [Pyrinomonadaceae bacterium]
EAVFHIFDSPVCMLLNFMLRISFIRRAAKLSYAAIMSERHSRFGKGKTFMEKRSFSTRRMSKNKYESSASLWEF